MELRLSCTNPSKYSFTFWNLHVRLLLWIDTDTQTQRFFSSKYTVHVLDQLQYGVETQTGLFAPMLQSLFSLDLENKSFFSHKIARIKTVWENCITSGTVIPTPIEGTVCELWNETNAQSVIDRPFEHLSFHWI